MVSSYLSLHNIVKCFFAIIGNTIQLFLRRTLVQLQYTRQRQSINQKISGPANLLYAVTDFVQRLHPTAPQSGLYANKIMNSKSSNHR
jgi:hypothetical protein